jgi:Carboxypeptidase regulatory-like domain
MSTAFAKLLMMAKRCATTCVVWLALSANAFAQTSSVTGVVRDETGGTLPGVSVELKGSGRSVGLVVTDLHGTYRFDGVVPGHYQIGFALINFATSRRAIDVIAAGTARVDAVLHLALNADVTATGKRTFARVVLPETHWTNLVRAGKRLERQPSAAGTSKLHACFHY